MNILKRVPSCSRGTHTRPHTHTHTRRACSNPLDAKKVIAAVVSSADARKQAVQTARNFSTHRLTTEGRGLFRFGRGSCYRQTKKRKPGWIRQTSSDKGDYHTHDKPIIAATHIINHSIFHPPRAAAILVVIGVFGLKRQFVVVFFVSP